MLSGKTCSATALNQNGVPANRVKFGSEHRSWLDLLSCASCGTPRDGFHHPGCLLEQCQCGAQAVGCGCRYDEDLSEEEQEWDEGSEWAEFINRRPAAIIFDQDAGNSELIPHRFPLESETNALEFRHRQLLNLLRPLFAAAPGSFSSDQMLALACHGLADHLITSHSEARLKLRRSQVARAVNRSIVLVDELEGGIPDDLPEAMHSVIVGMYELGRLDNNSDPLASLVEVLSCHYGLPAETNEPPTCRCLTDFDPFQPSTEVQVRVHSGQEITALAPEADRWAYDHEPLRHFVAAGAVLSDDAPTYELQPNGSQQYGLINLRLLGRALATNSSPELWLYGPPHIPGPSQILALDLLGQPFLAIPDKRTRSHQRWEPRAVHGVLQPFLYDHNSVDKLRLPDRVGEVRQQKRD